MKEAGPQQGLATFPILDLLFQEAQVEVLEVTWEGTSEAVPTPPAPSSRQQPEGRTWPRSRVRRLASTRPGKQTPAPDLLRHRRSGEPRVQPRLLQLPILGPGGRHFLLRHALPRLPLPVPFPEVRAAPRSRLSEDRVAEGPKGGPGWRGAQGLRVRGIPARS